MNKKKVLKFLVIAVVVGVAGVWFFVFKLPTTDWYRTFTTKKGGTVTASELVTAYQTNEKQSDSLYNGKIIEVSGLVKESKKGEDGITTVVLQSADSTASVTIDLKGSIEPLKVGAAATVKGMCTGFLSDVTLNEGEIIKK
jgi:tRNA_anti-like